MTLRCSEFNAGTSGTMLFEGIPADMREPLPLLVRAFNQLGQEVGNVTRNVRIGKSSSLGPSPFARASIYTLMM